MNAVAYVFKNEASAAMNLLVSLAAILLSLVARGGRKHGNRQTDRHTHSQTKYRNPHSACAPRVNEFEISRGCYCSVPSLLVEDSLVGAGVTRGRGQDVERTVHLFLVYAVDWSRGRVQIAVDLLWLRRANYFTCTETHGKLELWRAHTVYIYTPCGIVCIIRVHAHR